MISKIWMIGIEMVVFDINSKMELIHFKLQNWFIYQALEIKDFPVFLIEKCYDDVNDVSRLQIIVSKTVSFYVKLNDNNRKKNIKKFIQVYKKYYQKRKNIIAAKKELIKQVAFYMGIENPEINVTNTGKRMFVTLEKTK